MQVKNPVSNLKHYTNRQDYLSSKKAGDVAQTVAKNMSGKEGLVDTATDAAKDVGDAVKTEISETSKSLSGSSGKDSLLGEAAKMVGTEALKAGLSNLKPAVDVAKNIAKTRAKVNKAQRVQSTQASKIRGMKKEPLVIFFTGFAMFSSDSDDGLRKLAEHLPNAKVMSWTDEEEAMEEIRKYKSTAPLILGGHSLGSDTAVNIAQELNTLDNGFRKVDLLVTIDSIGSDNDVIPTNTKKNLNFIGDEQGFFNDGPNIARNLNETDVINELRPESHLDIDNENSVMKKIFQEVTPIIENYEN
jgi:hypothetical protein